MAVLYSTKDGSPVEVPDAEVAARVASGAFGFLKGEAVKVISPEGTAGTVSAEELPAALSTGFEFDTSEMQAERAKEEKFGGRGIAAGAAGVARGLTMGLSDVALTTGDLVEPETLRELKDRNVGASVAGEIGGAILPTLFSGGTTAPASGARVAGTGIRAAGALPRAAAAAGRLAESGIVGVLEREGAETLARTVVSRAVATGAGSAVEGALYGVGQEISEAALGDTDLTAEKLMAGAGLGALLGGGIGGLFGASGTIARRATDMVDGHILKDLPASLRDFAETRAVKSAGAMLKDFRGMSRQGRTNEIGRDLLDNKIVTAGASLDDIAERAGAKADEVGAKIGAIENRLDEMAGASPEIASRRFNPAKAAQRIDAEIIAPLRSKPVFAGVVQQLDNEVMKLAELGDNAISFSDAKALKRSYDEFLNFTKEQTPYKEQLKRVRGIVNAEIEDAVESIATLADQDILSEFKEAKRLFRSMRETADIATDRLQRDEANRFVSPSDHGVGMAMGIGSLLTGGSLPGAMLQGAAFSGVNKMARERGPQFFAAAADKLSRLAIVEGLGRAVDKKIADGVRNFLTKTTQRAVAPISVNALENFRLAPKVADAGARKDKDEPREKRIREFQRVSQEIAEAATNPALLAERIGQGTAALHESAPLVTAGVQAAAVRATQFLFAKMPKNPAAERTMNPLIRKWQPSDVELAKFDRYVNAVENPLHVVEELRAGRVSREGVEVLRDVYPKLYEKVQAEFLAGVSEMQEQIPYSDRLQLSTLLGVPVESTMAPEFVADMQQRHAALDQQRAEQNAGPGATGAGAVRPTAGALGKISLGSTSATASERIAAR